MKDTDDKNRPCLICLHHAGGNASVFNRLLRIDPHVLALPVELPGHGRRNKEELCSDLKCIAADLANDISKEFCGCEIFIYGHSFGSLVAFELCRELETKYGIFPKELIVSGRDAPCYRELKGFDHNKMTEKELLEEMRSYGYMPEILLNNCEFMKSFVPMALSDYYMIGGYEYEQGEKLHAPIHLNYGDEDRDIVPEKADDWGRLTTGGFSKKVYHGDHFFMFNSDSTYFEELIKRVKTASEICIGGKL